MLPSSASVDFYMTAEINRLCNYQLEGNNQGAENIKLFTKQQINIADLEQKGLMGDKGSMLCTIYIVFCVRLGGLLDKLVSE